MGSEVVELVHTDVLVMPEVGLKGERYVVTAYDDASTFSLVRTFVHKSDVSSALRAMITYLENKSGKLVKYLRSDRGGEYLSSEFELYCEQRGIQLRNPLRGFPSRMGLLSV